MLTSSFHNPYDPLQRSHMVPEAVRGGRLAVRIGFGALAGIILAAAGSLDSQSRDTVDRQALAGTPPHVVAASASPRGEPAPAKGGLSH